MKRLIIGISGASGAIYGVRLLQVLRDVAEVETHLVMSNAARQTLALETPYSLREVQALADGARCARHRRRHLLRLLQDPGHGDPALLDQNPVRHRQQLQRRAADPPPTWCSKSAAVWCCACGKRRCIWGTCG